MSEVQVRRSYAPTNKAVAATGGSAFGAAVTTVILHMFGGGAAIAPELETAITTIVTGLITGLAAYFTPPGAAEAVFKAANGAVVSGRVIRPPADAG